MNQAVVHIAVIQIPEIVFLVLIFQNHLGSKISEIIIVGKADASVNSTSRFFRKIKHRKCRILLIRQMIIIMKIGTIHTQNNVSEKTRSEERRVGKEEIEG